MAGQGKKAGFHENGMIGDRFAKSMGVPGFSAARRAFE
jgi:hypothetical protein